MKNMHLMLGALAMAFPAVAAQVYSVPTGERIYPGYEVSVDGVKAPVSEVRCSAIPFNRRWPGRQRQIEQTELCGMVRFAFEGKATVSVTATRDFKDVKIRPLSRNVAFRREGRTVVFDLVRPGGYSVEFDGYHNNLHVFADAKEAAPAKGAASCSATVFGPGVHDIGIRELKSGDSVYIDPGAIVYGGFCAVGATNVAILGRGILDGGKLKEKILFPASGDGHEAVKNAKRVHTINFKNCRNVKIDGLTIRDSLLYNIAMWGCEDVSVSGVKIVGQWRFNTDGIDLHNCRRAKVTDSFARTYDDTFCFKAHEGYGNCEDCVFERCVAWNDWGKAFEVGVECRADHLRRLAFRDCDCIHAVSWIMDVSNVDYGRVSDVVFDGIRIEADEPMPAAQLQKTDDMPFDPKKGLDAPPRLLQASVHFHHEYSRENGGKWSGGGSIDGVTLSNVSITTDGRKPFVKFGRIDEKHRPENVVFEDLSVNGKPVADASDIVLKIPDGVPPPRFKVRDDAKRMGAEMMNPGKSISCMERKDGGSFRVLIYGNSIALHGIAPHIGWTNLWGMAASAREKDFAHLVVSGLEAKRGGRADFRIRNLATVERNITANLADFPDLADDVEYAPDYVVIALGENVPGLDAAGADAYRSLLVSLARPLVASAKRPPVVLRSPFWKNAVKAKCTALAAAEVGAAYVDAGPLGDNPENMALGLFAHQGVARHPGDLGMKRLADLILDGIADWERGRSIDVSVAGAARATLSFRVQSPPEENPTYVFLAEYGSFKEAGSFRVTFNGRRERRVCGFYGNVRVYSAPNALDDGLLHHVALDIEPGRMMTLFLDGRAVDSAPVPSNGFAAGRLSIAKRDAKEPLHWTHFRGRVADVKLEPAAFDPSKVAGGVEPRREALALPPDPFAASPTWERPKTTRRYLHGPFAERMLTFWREGKIVFGEVEHRDDWSLDYRRDLHAHAAWLVHGGRDEPFDFRAAEMRLPQSGEPDHSQVWRMGPVEVELAACAPFGRRPSAHVRLTVRNAGDKPVKEPFAFLLREGLESRLVFGAPDVYRIFRPSLSDWDGISPDGWRRDGDVFLHGDRFAAFSGVPFEWDAANGAVRFALALAPGESKSVEMELGRGDRQGLGYEDARRRMYADWAAELAKLRLPERLGAKEARIVRNLAVQMLQCLSMPTEGDFVLPRQGGLQRYIWPGDADCFLEALDAIGYGDYVAKAIDFYYSHCQRKNGEAGPFKNNWAGDTASVLKTFARHCSVTGDAGCWRRWRDAAFKGFEWIQATRAAGGGLFPAMKATDHPAVLRAWGSNDLKGLEAFDAFAAAAAKFGDPRADEIAEAAKDYRKELSKAMDVWRAKAAGQDEFRVPISAEGDDDPLTEAFMFYLHPGRFAEAGLLTADEMLRLRTWLMRRGYANENGLYDNQIARHPECRAHIWYTTWSELQWFRAWRRVGREDLAKQALDACLRFALTDELYVGERYHDANPWYYPWSPNASGSGRIVFMLLDSAGM